MLNFKFNLLIPPSLNVTPPNDLIKVTVNVYIVISATHFFNEALNHIPSKSKKHNLHN